MGATKLCIVTYRCMAKCQIGLRSYVGSLVCCEVLCVFSISIFFQYGAGKESFTVFLISLVCAFGISCLYSLTFCTVTRDNQLFFGVQYDYTNKKAYLHLIL